jgi:type III pantothenate kinase
MENLIIDLGNTVLKAYVFKNDSIIDNGIASDYLHFSKIIDEFKNAYEISNCIISSVRADDEAFLQFLKSDFDLIIMSASLQLPVEISYKTPQTLGLDRLAAVCGASFLFPNENVLVIDAGTAITYDFLESGKIYHGGTISPGINTRFKALHNFTGKLPLLSINKDLNNVLGETTEEAIILGVQNGIIHEVNGVIAAFVEKFGKITVVFTGGDSFFFDYLIKSCIFAEPNLTAFGLNKILKLNV